MSKDRFYARRELGAVFREAENTPCAGNIAVEWLSQLGRPEHVRLMRLWENWQMVMGEDLSDLACPLGHSEGVLLVGAEDAMSMQELHYYSDEMLERANAFMDAVFFTEVRIRLILGRKSLDAVRPASLVGSAPEVALPCATGKYLKKMNLSSSLGRCYEKFSQNALKYKDKS